MTNENRTESAALFDEVAVSEVRGPNRHRAADRRARGRASMPDETGLGKIDWGFAEDAERRPRAHAPGEPNWPTPTTWCGSISPTSASTRC